MNIRKINIISNLVFLRKANGMTFEEVADKIGVSRQAVAKLKKLALPQRENIYLA